MEMMILEVTSGKNAPKMIHVKIQMMTISHQLTGRRLWLLVQVHGIV